jgi:hypothetical protein
MQRHPSDGIWSRRLALTDRTTSQPSSGVSQRTWKRVDSSVKRAIGTPTANASAGQGIDRQVRNSLKAYEVLAMCGMLPDSAELNPPVFASSVNCDQKLAPNGTPSASRPSCAHTHRAVGLPPISNWDCQILKCIKKIYGSSVCVTKRNFRASTFSLKLCLIAKS